MKGSQAIWPHQPYEPVACWPSKLSPTLPSEARSGGASCKNAGPSACTYNLDWNENSQDVLHCPQDGNRTSLKLAIRPLLYMCGGTGTIFLRFLFQPSNLQKLVHRDLGIFLGPLPSLQGQTQFVFCTQGSGTTVIHVIGSNLRHIHMHQCIANALTIMNLGKSTRQGDPTPICGRFHTGMLFDRPWSSQKQLGVLGDNSCSSCSRCRHNVSALRLSLAVHGKFQWWCEAVILQLEEEQDLYYVHTASNGLSGRIWAQAGCN